jgi:transposase
MTGRGGVGLRGSRPRWGSAGPVASRARTDTFLGERCRRIARRRGKKRAIVAIGRSILVIIWALLSDEQAQFVDLGPDYYAVRNNPERKARHHIRELQALGYSITLNPAA